MEHYDSQLRVGVLWLKTKGMVCKSKRDESFLIECVNQKQQQKNTRLSFSSCLARVRLAMACRESPVVWLISRVQCLLGRAKLYLNKYICAKVGLTQENKFTKFSTPWGRFEREIIFCEKQLELCSQ